MVVGVNGHVKRDELINHDESMCNYRLSVEMNIWHVTALTVIHRCKDKIQEWCEGVNCERNSMRKGFEC